MRALTLLAASVLVLGCPGPAPQQDAGPPGSPPTIQQVSPGRGPTSGGTQITVDGANFQSGAKIRVGGTLAGSVSFTSAFRLTAATPAGAPGTASVTVVNPDGQAATLQNGFTYYLPDSGTDAGTDAGSDAGPVSGVDWCNLQFPPSVTTFPGLFTPTIYGRVISAGNTGSGTPNAAIAAEVGFGPVDAGPSTGAWQWTSASFNQSYGAADEYQAKVLAPDAGSYAYLYRFSLDGGPRVYCDLQGGDGGYSLANAGAMTVLAPGSSVYSCRITSISATTTPSGAPLTATAAVRVPGLTERPGPSAGLIGEVGIGDADPRDSGLWGWGPAAYQSDTDAGEDQFAANFTAAYSGGRDVAFRFSLDDGGSWTYCDTTGAPFAFDPNAEQALTVGVPELDFCNLQYPPTINQSFDGGSTTVYGQLFVSGVTTRDAGDPVLAQLGYGQKNEDPGVSTDWVWIDAGYDTPQFATVNGLPNNEYNAAFTGIAPGSYAYAFRFTVDGGSWCYGDLDGAGSNEDGNGTQGGFNGDSASGPNLGVANVTP